MAHFLLFLLIFLTLHINSLGLDSMKNLIHVINKVLNSPPYRRKTCKELKEVIGVLGERVCILTSSHLMKLLPFLRVCETQGGWSFSAWTPG